MQYSGSLEQTEWSEDIYKWLMKACFFLSTFVFFDTGLLTSPQIYLHYFLLFPLLFISMIRYGTLPVPLLLPGLFFLVVGIYHIILGNNTPALFLKVFISLGSFYLFFYYFLKTFEFDIEYVFSLYMKGAVFSSILLLIQLGFVLLNFRPGYDISFFGLGYKIQPDEPHPAALLPEPAHFAGVISSAVFVAIHNIVRKKSHFINLWQSLLVITALLLSTSSTGYLSLFLCFVVISINYRAISVLVISLVLGVAGFYVLYLTVPKFKMRLDDSIGVFVEQQLTSEDQLKNGSTMILYNNLQIAFENFRQHPITGTGLGSHPIAHEKFNQFDVESFWWAESNKEEANGMFIRLLSETGLSGLLLVAVFLFRFGVSKEMSVNETNWIISKAILILIVSNLLRQGNYIAYGFPLFVLMYYYVYKMNREPG